MSKLGDRIRKVLRVDSPPMGFAAASTRAANPSLLVTALFGSLAPERASEAASGRADTCLFAVSDAKDGEVQETLAALGETPAGLLLRQVERPSLDRLADLGLDYVAFAPEAAPATALLHATLGHVLVLEGDLSDAHLRTLEAMPLDALFVRSWKGPLTVRAQMDLQRIAGLSRKPLMLPVPPQVSEADLEALRETGVVLLAVDGDRRENLEALPSLRQAIDALPARRQRREERLEAVLPAASVVAAVSDEEEGDEDDEEP